MNQDHDDKDLVDFDDRGYECRVTVTEIPNYSDSGSVPLSDVGQWNCRVAQPCVRRRTRDTAAKPVAHLSIGKSPSGQAATNFNHPEVL